MFDSANISETLESAIDSIGLESVIRRLADVASLKAEHVDSNWQDGRLASQWDKAAGILVKMADAIPDSVR